MCGWQKQIMDAWARLATKTPTSVICIESKQAA
jgi:hypothetical protein